MTFPDEHDLVAFFEAEPKVLDPGVPWLYNTLDFETERQGILVRCRFAPSYGVVGVRLYLAETIELVQVDVSDYAAIELVVNADGEALIATSNHESPMLCLTLEPRVWVGLGNFNRIPPEL